MGSALITTVRRAARVGAPNSSRGRAKNPSSARPPRTHTQGHLVRARVRVRVRVRARVRARVRVRVRVGTRARARVRARVRVRARHAAHFSKKNGQQQASVRARARARVSYRVRVRGACSLLEEERPAARGCDAVDQVLLG